MSRHHHTIPSRAWDRVRRQVLDRDGWRCTRCGLAGLLEVHHLVALEDGGAELDPDNCTTLCRGCHVDHHRRQVSPERQEWLDAIVQIAPSSTAPPA